MFIFFCASDNQNQEIQNQVNKSNKILNCLSSNLLHYGIFTTEFGMYLWNNNILYQHYILLGLPYLVTNAIQMSVISVQKDDFNNFIEYMIKNIDSTNINIFY